MPPVGKPIYSNPSVLSFTLSLSYPTSLQKPLSMLRHQPICCHQRSYAAPLLLLCIVLLLISVANSANVDFVMDDFGLQHGNKILGQRTIISLDDLDHLDKLWDGTNACPNLGNGISIDRPGLYLVEMLTSRNERTDLFNKALEIKYTARNEGTRAILFFQYSPSNVDGVSTISHEIHRTFKAGENRLVIPLSDFKGANPALAQGFGIEGPLAVHQLKLLTDRSTVDSIVLVDLRRKIIPRQPWHHWWNFIPGVGYQISDPSGSLSVSLPWSSGKFIKIQYSANDLGTRLVSLLTDAAQRDARTRPGETCMHVVFNPGQYRDSIIPLPRTCQNNLQLSTNGINIQGPIIVHEIELLNTAPVHEIAPGESTTDAMLIDDFSDWSDGGKFNNIQKKRHLYATIGQGSIILNGNGNYVKEHFTDTPEVWNLYASAFRITYTAVHAVTCKFSLIANKDRDRFDNESGVEFHSGTRTQVTIPISQLINFRQLYRKSPYVAFMIRGPQPDYPNDEIIIHRLEIMSRIPYEQPIHLVQPA